MTYGILPETDQEIALKTRSMLQIMVGMATEIDVPPEHVAEGRTVASTKPSGGEGSQIKDLIRIKTATTNPEDAFVSVRYKDYWFWIDDRDFLSKRAFTFLMILISLTESGGKEGLPIITIPSG